jgi:hypothetical protein
MQAAYEALKLRKLAKSIEISEMVQERRVIIIYSCLQKETLNTTGDQNVATM